MELDKYFKRYIWDDAKTPYLIPVGKLSRRQAAFEIRAYTIFLGFLFAMVAVAALSRDAPGGRSMGVSLYAFSMVCAAVILAFSKHHVAALYCATAPPAALLYFYVFGFHPNLSLIDHVVIVVFVLLWARYAWRVCAIGRQYEDMPPGEADDSAGRAGRRRR